jgi:hypothetical protein
MSRPTTIDITTTSLDNPNIFATFEVWLEHRLSWQGADPSRTQYPRSTHDPAIDQLRIPI